MLTKAEDFLFGSALEDFLETGALRGGQLLFTTSAEVVAVVDLSPALSILVEFVDSVGKRDW